MMAARRGPTLRAQLLGQQLRQLREEARLTIRDLAEYIQRDASTVSRFESGILPARVPEVLAYLDLCGIDDRGRRDALKQLSQDVFQKGWWDGYADDVAGSLVDRIWLESRASAIRVFETVVVPGLLQTPEYAETIIRAADPDANDSEITRWVEIRLTRQRLLTQPNPVQLTAILDEAVLRRRVGGVSVLRAQLDHLTQRASQPNIDLLVLPAAAGAHASPDGPFEILEMPEPYPDFGLIQTPAGQVCVESTDAVRLTGRYDRLCEMVLTGADALAFVADVAKDVR
jgi:transcriptional regulator with XRE-family HTH domain